MVMDDTAIGFPSVKIYGVGGAGKVAALKFKDNERVSIVTMDTSGIDNDIANVESYKIKNMSGNNNLQGSGRIRSHNTTEIIRFVNEYCRNKQVFDDVNIIIYSMSGGSGSVIGPLLVDEILKQKKLAISICIVDHSSEIDTINTFNTFRTLNRASEIGNLYIPVIVFDNKFGKHNVDNGVYNTVVNLINVFTKEYISIDIQDRLNLFNPIAFHNVQPGIKLINISTADDGNWNEDYGLIIPEDIAIKLDSVMIITPKYKNVCPSCLCSVIFNGYTINDTDETYIISVGYQIPQSLIDNLNNKINDYNKANMKVQTSFHTDFNNIGKESDSILIV